MVDDSANIPKKKQLTLSEHTWIMTKSSYGVLEITLRREVLVIKFQYFIQHRDSTRVLETSVRIPILLRA